MTAVAATVPPSSAHARALLSVSRLVSPREHDIIGAEPDSERQKNRRRARAHAEIAALAPPADTAPATSSAKLAPRRTLRIVGRLPKRAPLDGVALLDLLSVEVGRVRLQYSEALERANGLEIRQAAVERGLERAITCGDTVAAAVGNFETELRTFERRLIMSESALERIFNIFERIRSCTA